MDHLLMLSNIHDKRKYINVLLYKTKLSPNPVWSTLSPHGDSLSHPLGDNS